MFSLYAGVKNLQVISREFHFLFRIAPHYVRKKYDLICILRSGILKIEKGTADWRLFLCAIL